MYPNIPYCSNTADASNIYFLFEKKMKVRFSSDIAVHIYIYSGPLFYLILILAIAWKGLGANINPKTGSAEGIGYFSDFVKVNFCKSLVKIINSSALARVSPKQYLLPVT